MDATVLQKELNRVLDQLSELQEHKQKLEALLPFYQNGVIEIQRDFLISVEPKVYKKKSNGQSDHSKIVSLARELAGAKGIVFSRHVLDLVVKKDLLPGKDRNQMTQRISNIFALEVQRNNFKKV